MEEEKGPQHGCLRRTVNESPRLLQGQLQDQYTVDPLTYGQNFSIMSEYMTEMGRIRHSRETGLRPVNQRKIAKAIRRAIGVGLMPSIHRHPELLKRELMDTRMTGRPG